MAIRIGVVGAGLAGAMHIAALAKAKHVMLAAVTDPERPDRELAGVAGASWFDSIEEMLRANIVDGVILATPNQLHASGGLACIRAKVPVLVEKPLCHRSADAAELVNAAVAGGVPLVVGHHRRHNPVAQEARRVIDSGCLGTVTSLHAQAWLMKPDSYFRDNWRTGIGGGPVFVNLIHDIDLLQYLCGPIMEVQAMESNAHRGHSVEDTAVVLLRYASGLLGTVNLCDAAAAPWSWELTAHENPAYDRTDRNCYWIAGSRKSLAVPRLDVWQHAGEEGWWTPIRATRIPVPTADPMVRQIEQFAAVIRGEEPPLVSGADGLSALRVVEAIKRAAREARTVAVANVGTGYFRDDGRRKTMTGETTFSRTGSMPAGTRRCRAHTE